MGASFEPWSRRPWINDLLLEWGYCEQGGAGPACPIPTGEFGGAGQFSAVAALRARDSGGDWGDGFGSPADPYGQAQAAQAPYRPDRPDRRPPPSVRDGLLRGPQRNRQTIEQLLGLEPPTPEPRQLSRRGMSSRSTRDSSPSVREQERMFRERQAERDEEFGRGRHRSPEAMRSLGDRKVDAAFDSMHRRENMSMAPRPRSQGQHQRGAASSFFIGGPEDLGYYDEDDEGPGLLLG